MTSDRVLSSRFHTPIQSSALVAIIAMAAGCAPQSAELLSGDYTGWIAEGTSVTMAKDNLVDEDFDRHSIYDCQYFDIADPGNKSSVTNLGNAKKKKLNAMRRSDRAIVCPDDDAANWIEHESWLYKAAYHVVGGDMDPWRGEAIITSEGDFQISFHQRLPGHEDLRFSIAIDPTFAPTGCVPNADGQSVSLQPVDGQSWVEAWSEGLDGSVYFLNGGAYQFNPGESSLSAWTLPNNWMSGYAGGKFADDLLRSRSTRFAVPELYIESESNTGGQSLGYDPDDLYFCSAAAAPSGAAYKSCMRDLANAAQADAETVQSELMLAGLPADADGLPSSIPFVENNSWRAPDALASGLDRWVGMNYSWIRFDEGSDLTVGGSASGEFSVMFDGTQSGVRVYVRGKFDVPHIRKDLWFAKYLPPIKQEQNDTPKCGG